MIARRAGKPFVYDHFAVGQRIEARQGTQAEVNWRMAAADTGFEEVDAENVALWR